MEPDRYEQSHAYFISGIIGLIVSLGFFGVCLYVLPYLLFNIHYALPKLFSDLGFYVMSKYQLAMKAAQWWVFLGFLSIAVVAALVAFFASNYIDNQIYHAEVAQPVDWEDKSQKYQESGGLILKIIFSVAVVFIVSMLFQWVISPTPPQDTF